MQNNRILFRKKRSKESEIVKTIISNSSFSGIGNSSNTVGLFLVPNSSDDTKKFPQR